MQISCGKFFLKNEAIFKAAMQTNAAMSVLYKFGKKNCWIKMSCLWQTHK